MKRCIDIVMALCLAIFLLPVALLLAFFVWLDLGKPILFRQVRPGLNEQPFVLYKFRTMRDATGSSDNPLDDAGRLTRFGSFLRRTSLDEIPQLLNVIRGDMSLVGPRPLLKRYLGRYTPRQKRRHEVRPGLTGWTQVKGRNAIDWEKKLELDVWYVENRSFWLDLRILFLTLWKVLTGEGISQPGHATAEEFMGSEPGPAESRAVE